MHSDVAIVGGGPAGLQAALTLGRIHRKAVVLDDGTYRNIAVPHMHNVLTNDGRPPGEYRAVAHQELAAYDSVAVRRVRAQGIVRSGTRIGIIGGESAAHYAAMLGPIASELVVLTNGEPLPQTWQGGAEVRTEPIASVERHDGGVRVTLRAGKCGDATGRREHEQVSVLFVRPTLHQSAPFAEQLGLERNPSGCVRIDEFGRTSRPRVYAAGDLAHQPAFPGPMASVVMAQAMGQMAALGAHSALMEAGL